jgi:hypothetical protein
MISEQHIRGNANMSEDSRMFCAGAMISVGLFFAIVCLALRGAHMNTQNMLALLDKVADRMDAWFNKEPILPVHNSPKPTDKNAVAIILVPQLDLMGKGVASAIRLPRSLSAGNLGLKPGLSFAERGDGLRIRSPPMTPQFTDRTDLFIAPASQKQDV